MIIDNYNHFYFKDISDNENYLYLNEIVKLPDLVKTSNNNDPLSYLNEYIKPIFTIIDDEGLNTIIDSNHLSEAFHKYSSKGLIKKETVQRYRANKLRNELHIKKSIFKNKYKPDKPNEFILNERGHIRYIKASSVKDQVIQRSLNDNLLVPKTKRKLIYDNCASLKDKGISLQRKRFKIHLQNAYKEFKDEGYILSIDFTKYFDNIDHSKILLMYSKFLTNNQIDFLKTLFSEFEIDVSYMNDIEYELAKSEVFNSLVYNEFINSNPDIKNKLDGSKVLKKSMGIGNQLSQISGIYYPTKIDNYCKIVKGIKYYGRYMDDIYVIVKTKNEAKELLKEIKDMSKENGVFINDKKTSINSIHGQNTFLKIKYTIKDSGKVIERPVNETFRRERKRLSKFKKLIDNNRMDLNAAINCYKSWRGSYLKFDCKSKIKEMDNFVKSKFKLPYNYNFNFKK